MISQSDFKYSAISLRDPVGNVVFACNRVFRIISAEYKEIALAFLQSELYRELLRKEWIVRTWISNDVECPNETLILEHEKLSFTSSALWSFSQWKDAATLTLNVRDLCISKGGDFRDCRPNNIAFKNGHPVILDFGSFLFKEHTDKQYWEYLFYCTFYRAIYHMSYREPFMAHAWGEYASYYFIDGQISPSQTLENTAFFRKIYGNLIKYYDVCIRQKYKHFRVYTPLGRWILQLCNLLARFIFKKEKIWHLFKMQAVFKKPLVQYIDNFKLLYNSTICSDNNESMEMIKNLYSILKDYINIKRIMLYGTFNIDDIISLRKVFSGDILVASNDDIYIDKIYNKVKKERLNISVVFYDIFMEQDIRINEAMKVDLICVQGGKNICDPISGSVMKFYRQSPIIYTNNVTHYSAMLNTTSFVEVANQPQYGKLYVRK